MEITMYTLRSISSAVISPPLVFILVSLMIIFYLKNKKIAAMQKIIVGGEVDSALELTLSQFVLGIIAGTTGSIMLTQLGVKFNYECGIQYLFFVSIILMFIKPKYICFSYSAGILGLVSIMIEIISMIIPSDFIENIFKIDILYLLLFVGVLHMVEGILVMIDGYRGAIPVFSESENEIIGGYAFKRYWVLPIAMLFMTTGLKVPNSIEMIMDMPLWWSVINGRGLAMVGVLVMMPLYAVVGYSSITFTKSKREKSVSSGINILLYGMSVIAVSQIVRIGVIGKIFAVIFTPAAHEFMLKRQKREEKKNKLKFVSDDEGLVILDISSDSQMNQYALEIGDKILDVNGSSISSERDIYSILKKNLYSMVVRIKKKNGEIHEFNHVYDRSRRLGILLVPKKVLKEDIVPVKESSFKTILEEIKRVKDSQNGN
ncbi:MAG: signal protein PDZ [Clostridium sp.]|nr:signal protein PDZ [Clostridium sp.]